MEQPCETQGWIHLPFLAVEFQGNDGIAPLGAGKGADKHGGVLWTQLELWELWQYWSWISVGKGSRKCQFLPSHLQAQKGVCPEEREAGPTGNSSGLMLIMRKEVQALPTTHRSPREGKRALQAPFLLSELGWFRTSFAFPHHELLECVARAPRGCSRFPI